jgi:predicted RNase H-like HicB family nuclease
VPLFERTGPAGEALKNIKEAVELYLEAVEDDEVFPANSEIIELAA